MAEVVWAEPALTDLDAIADYIAIENPSAAPVASPNRLYAPALNSHPVNTRNVRRASALCTLEVFAVAVIGCGGATSAPSPPPAPPAVDWAPITARMERLAAEGARLNGAALVVVTRDSVLFERGFGAMTPTSTILIASASKWLSAAVLMAVVDQNALALDDSVGRFIPSAPADKRGITVRQLYAHTSGLPGLENVGDIVGDGCLADRATTLAACSAQILGLPLVSTPGTEFYYGGASMTVAAHMAERASLTSWPQLFELRLRAPLNFTATTFGASANPRVSGGAVSNAREYARFLQMLLNDGVWQGRRVLSTTAITAMESDQTRGARIAYSPHTAYGNGSWRYGIGLWRDRVAAGGALQQGSSQGAFGFSPWIDRERGIAAVIAVQSTLANVYTDVADVQRLLRDAVDASRR